MACRSLSFSCSRPQEDYLDPTLRFPVISKLNAIHGSVEITAEAVSENEKQLRKRLRKLIRTYDQPVLVEEFVGRREITAILLEGSRKKVYLAEKIFRAYRGPVCLPDLRRPVADRDERGLLLPALPRPGAERSWCARPSSVAHMADYGKFDIRLDEAGRYDFIDTDLQPGPGAQGAGRGHRPDPGPVWGQLLRTAQAPATQYCKGPGRGGGAPSGYKLCAISAGRGEEYRKTGVMAGKRRPSRLFSRQTYLLGVCPVIATARGKH